MTGGKPTSDIRPKKFRLDKYLRLYLHTQNPKDGTTPLQKICKRMVLFAAGETDDEDLAKAGTLEVIKEVLNRGFGKPRETQEVLLKDGRIEQLEQMSDEELRGELKAQVMQDKGLQEELRKQIKNDKPPDTEVRPTD